MPPKKRSEKRRYELSLELLSAGLNLDTWESHWGSEEEARRAWLALEQEWLSRHGRPPIWWAYTADVPDELREEVPDADPRLAISLPGEPPPDPEDVREYEQQKRRFIDHQAARLRWLRGDPPMTTRPPAPYCRTTAIPSTDRQQTDGRTEN